jgi:hypothetical protein
VSTRFWRSSNRDAANSLKSLQLEKQRKIGVGMSKQAAEIRFDRRCVLATARVSIEFREA